MAISPLRPASTRATQVTITHAPSRTYAIDLDTGEVAGVMIDGLEAVRQFIRKAIATPRYRYRIYNESYGCEIEALIGQDVSAGLLQAEIPRMITEAIIYDDRILDVSEFAITRTGDALYVSFDVETIFGTISEEVTV